MVIIYALLSPLFPFLVYYVGSTGKSLETRYRQHLGSPSHRQTPRRPQEWIKELQDRGLKPEIKLLEKVPYTERARAEAAWIAHFMKADHPLLNTQLRPEEAEKIRRTRR